MFTDVKEAIAYIESKRSKRTIEQFKETLKKCQINCKQKNMIHIAGTNGKGSTVNYLRSIFNEHGYNVGAYFFESVVGVESHAMRHDANDGFDEQEVFDVGHIGPGDVAFAQRLGFLAGATVAVDDAMRLDVVKTLQVVKCACGFNYFSASTQGFDGVFGVQTGVQLHIYAAVVGTFDEKDGLAASQKVEVDIFGQQIGAVEYFVVPQIFLGIV